LTGARLASGAVVAAVLGIAALAAVDALRGRERAAPDPPAPPPPTVEEREGPSPSPQLVRRLQEEGLSGFLVVADADCRVRTLALPGLERVAAGEHACSLRGSGGPRVLEGQFGPMVAECRDGRIAVRTRGVVVRELPGCLPAWRPDRSLVFVRDGALWGLTLGCPPRGPACERLLLSRGDLRQASVAGAALVDQVWLSETRGAVLFSWPAGGYVLGLFEGRRLVATHRWGGGGPGRLEVAPGGGLFTARPARVFRRDGSPVTLAPRFRNARAVEWSPDGRWAAVAMGGALVLAPTTGLVAGAETRRAIRLPFTARDVAWRAP
jgi:hypothetical protein